MSKRFTLNKEDIKKVLKNALLFVAPDLIVFLGALQVKASAEGAVFVILGLNILIDLSRKFVAGK